MEGWARDGLIDEQIAANIGIAPATLYEWKNRFPEISDTLKKGKEVVDIMVENALLKRALGYEYDETSKKYENGLLTETKIVKKQVIPDTTAQIFWLKNRRPDRWRDKPDEKKTDGIQDLLKNIQTMTDIIRKPVPDRNIEDFEA